MKCPAFYGASVLTGLMRNRSKIKGFRHSIIGNNLIYMHYFIYLISKSALISVILTLLVILVSQV